MPTRTAVSLLTPGATPPRDGQIEKHPTGIPGFNLVAYGGLPKGRTTLVAGTAGSAPVHGDDADVTRRHVGDRGAHLDDHRLDPPVRYGEMWRGVTVLKMRGSMHDKDIRELDIDSTGMHIGRPFGNEFGILSGNRVHVAAEVIDRQSDLCKNE